MRTRVFLALMLWSLALRLRAEDLKPPPEVRRLEYIHYQAGAHVVCWGVSHGTVSEDGEYVQSGDKLGNYSLDLETGDMTRDGEHAAMSPENAYAASLVFEGVSRLMATYTDGMDEAAHMDTQESGTTNSGDPGKAGAGSATQPGPRHRRSPAGERLRKSESLARGPVQQIPRAVALASVVH